MNNVRRNFLKLGAMGACSLALPLDRLMAQDKPAERTGATQPTLVVIYLRGGADALNVIVPFADKRYFDIRPSIALPLEDGDGAKGVIKLDKQFALNPAMAALKPHFDAGRVAPLVCVGSNHTTRSHFDAQDFMERGAPGLRNVRNGWLNRFLEATNKSKASDEQLRALGMQTLLPRALRGDFPVLAVPDDKVLNDPDLIEVFKKVYEEEKKKEAEGEMKGEKREEDTVKETGQDTVKTLQRYVNIIKKPIAGKRASFGTDPFAKRMKDIATVIRANVGLEVAALDYNGWDDHVNENGQLAARLKMYADGLAAFMEDLGDALSNTLIVTMTEFGRTCKENGNDGTDHGHGGFMFLMGGKAKGGKVHGQWMGLEEKDLYEKRDLPVTTDFRDVFNTVLTQHMKFEAPKGFFPDYTPKAVAGLF